MNNPEIIQAWANILNALLPFLSTLIWQILLIYFIYYYRSELSKLLNRIVKLKIGDNEAYFQDAAEDAKPLTGEAKIQNERLGTEYFYTKDQIVQLVEKSGSILPIEKVGDPIKLFDTRKQHTWLVPTNKKLFCILDDKNTRTSGRLIQWILPLEEASPIIARAHKRTVGIVQIGSRRNWLYSQRLWSKPEFLEQEIKTLITKAQTSPK